MGVATSEGDEEASRGPCLRLGAATALGPRVTPRKGKRIMNELSPFLRDRWASFPRSFEDFFQSYGAKPEGALVVEPRIDVTETPDHYEITAEIPGVETKDVQINLVGDTLTIRGEKTQEEKREDAHRHVVERRYGAFERSMVFPSPIEPDAVSAESKDGVITVCVKKATEQRARRIEVKKKGER
jgi:HSP20 family protein